MNSWLGFGKVTTVTPIGIKNPNNLRSLRLGTLALSLLLIRQVSIHTNGLTDGPILCPVRLLTGFPCPACGTTRAIGAISEGRFADALSLNPLGFVVLGVLILWSLDLPRLSQANRRFNASFAKLATSSKVSLLLSLYAIAWILNIFRITSATF